MRTSRALPLAFFAAFTAAADPCPPQRFLPDFEPRSLEFGVDVAINDRHLVIVDRFAKTYTYRRDPDTSQWVFLQAVPGGSGGSVSLDGDRFIVGTVSVDRFGGALVYDFDGDQWNESAILQSPDDPRYATSGEQVVLHGDRAAFANWGTLVRLFYFAGGTWEFVREIQAPEGQPGSIGFGRYGMDMDDRFFVISAPNENISGIQNGAVYVYEWDAEGLPQLLQKLEPDEFDVGPRLGESVAIEGDTLVAGARSFQIGCGGEGNAFGAAYVYTFDGSTWELRQILTAPDPPCRGLDFGWDVAISGDLIAVGARGDTPGAVHLYRRNADHEWQHARKIELEDIGGFDYGEAVDFGGQQLVIGASEGFTMGFDQGVADVFDLSCLVCRPDFDADGTLTVFDFLAFFNAFDDGDPVADFDGDGEFTIFDFLAYQTAFDAGCE